MLKEFTIERRKYFLLCTLNKEKVECILFNEEFNETWRSKNESMEKILQLVKNLNKRIRFDEAAIRETLQNGDLEHCCWEDCAGDVPEKVLKLKYRINKRPFNFEWHLIKQLEQEFKYVMVARLSNVISGLSEQVQILRETVEKKETEIVQYKNEGAVLRRKTLATGRFDWKQFDDKFGETNLLASGLKSLAEQLQLQLKAPEDMSKNNEYEIASIKEEVETEVFVRKNSNKQVKENPKTRKRKAQEEHMARHLNARKKKLAYVNSQTLSESLSEDLFDNAMQKVKLEKIVNNDDEEPNGDAVAMPTNEDDPKPTTSLSTTINEGDLHLDNIINELQAIDKRYAEYKKLHSN